jgi:hypothetical protein
MTYSSSFSSTTITRSGIWSALSPFFTSTCRSALFTSPGLTVPMTARPFLMKTFSSARFLMDT